MDPKRSVFLPPIFALLDVLLLVVIYFVSGLIWPEAWAREKFVFHVLLWLVPLTWFVVSFAFNLYDDLRIQAGREWNIRKISASFLLLVGIVLLVVVFGKFKLSRLTLLFYLLLNYLALLASGYIRHRFLGYIRSLGYSPRRIIFAGSGEEIGQLRKWISSHPERGFQNTHFIQIPSKDTPEDLLKRIRSLTDEIGAEELALGEFHEAYPGVMAIIDLAEEYGMRVYLHSHVPSALARRSNHINFGPFTALRVRQEPLNQVRARAVKRTVDLVITIPILLLVYLWLYLLFGAFIKMSSRGPIVFKQRRIGASGEPFLCYKFRTMRVTQPMPGGVAAITRKEDKRITWIGKFLRASNLDELPQFINVLKGDMSVVGPRPHMVEEDEDISKLLRRYKIRRFVKPGITGWAAIHGFRGGTDDMELMQRRIDHDIYYIENWTAWLDTRIVLATIWKMLTLNTGGR